MAGQDDDGRGFLRRWSQRKLAAAREAQAPAPPPAAAPLPVAPPAPVADATPPAAPDDAPAPPALPAVDTLTFDSDFRAFLSPEVEEGTRRAALRKLFSDPRFNVQDGLDVYIDDYNKFEPMTPEIVKQLAHARYLFDPPKTRINAQGWVEDVPPEEVAQAAADAKAAAEAAERDAAGADAADAGDADKPVQQPGEDAPGQAADAPGDGDAPDAGTEPGRMASEPAPAVPPTATLPADLPARVPVPRTFR